MSGTPRISISKSPNGTREDTKVSDGQKPEIELDVSKLHSLGSEQQDLYLFNFVTNLEQHINGLTPTALKDQQKSLKKEILKIVNLSSPAPNRVIRNSIGRCFGILFARGDAKLLFESIIELGELLNVSKPEKDTRTKHAAVFCLGEIFKARGDGAINLSGVTCASLTKLYKSSSNHVSLRAAIFRAFGKVVASIQGSMDEIVAKDIWKQSKGAASGDRGCLVQINACWCLEQLIHFTNYFDNTGDYDALKSLLWKVGDSQVVAVRHASASCLAAILVKAFSESTPVVASKIPKLKKAKKSAQIQTIVGGDGEDGDLSRPGSPTPKKSPFLLELSLQEVMRHLAIQYVKGSTSNRVRAMIISCYSKIFRSLDSRIIESNFSLIANHLLVDVLNNGVISNHRFRLLLTRRFVQKLLANVIGRQILGESSQLSAARTIISEILKNYPQSLAEEPEPAKHTLTGALNVLGSFVQSLGSAFSPLADSCRDALIQILQHPSYTVQIHASYCLRLFTLACPQQLIQCASICMNSVTRELSLLSTSRGSARKSLGYSNGLAAVLSTSSLQPLYSSLEISSRVFQQATALLKSSGNEELRVSGIQVQVAWVLIGGLMSLGPNFVKIHLTQLLLLWRNALPKPLTKQNSLQRQTAELSYLVLVRECALGCILSFLEFNARLLTTDVSKRIAMFLQNTIEFLETLNMLKCDGEISPRITASLQLPDLIQMVRRRVLQCFTRLAIRSPHTSKDILSDAQLLTFTASCFSEPEGYVQSSLGTSIANTTANFEGIWAVGDNSGFGVSGLIRGLLIKPMPGEKQEGNVSPWHWQLEPPDSSDSLLLSPVCGAREHDSISVHVNQTNGMVDELPDPPATEVVNAAIALFAMALPLQAPKIQESVLENLSSDMSAKSLQRDPGRKAAVTVNVTLALLGALKVNQNELPASPGDLKSSAVEKCLEEMLRNLIIDSDKYIRNIAYEALGRLCNGAGNAFTTNVVNSLVETIVSNREPNARAGCAMALAAIHSSVGGMAAGFHLRKIHGVLMSLCSDPHPTVHFWAVDALSKIAESAGLTFSGYMPSTLGLLAQLWLSDSHCQESDAIGTSNAELEMPTPAAIAYTISSLIGVLGPDLQDMAKARDLILLLVQQFDLDDLHIIQGLALQSWEHIYLYAPNHVELAKYVRQLQRGLGNHEPGVRETAVNGLYTLMRRDAQHVLDVADDGLEEQIWSSLDTAGEKKGIRSIIEVWLGQTGLSHTTEWIIRCQELLTKTLAKPADKPSPETKGEQSAAPNLQDEEVAGFAVSDGKDEDGGNNSVGQELLRWQVREFALHCLSDMFAACARDMKARPDSKAGQVVQSRVADVIRMAFLASTGSVVELRIGGLRLIDQVLVVFGRTPDPDFSEALLLEQYQAQISSALTPAFGADSSPELASTAINVCATFVATGLVKDVDRMGRILKLLVTSLQSFAANSANTSVGDLSVLSSNAQRMVKMAVLSAWAELQVASTEQEYLKKVVKPHVANLTPLWLSSLQDFARLRFEPDISNSMGMGVDESLDATYSALNRETLLKFYQDSWLILVDAIASLIDQDSDFVFDALDRKKNLQQSGPISNVSDINYRDEPVAFFFILYGIAFEALMTSPGKKQTLEILTALKKILRPSVSGNAIYQDIVFSETMELFDRLAQTEGLAIQGALVEITRNLCLTHPSVGKEAGEDNITDDMEQLFELTRIIVLVLAGVLPNLGENPTAIRNLISEEAVALITLSLDALVDASDVFPTVIRTDLHACIIHIFTIILGTGACQALVVPSALPIFKRFVETVKGDKDSSSQQFADQLRLCLVRFRAILAHAQRRETDASLLCARNTLLASVVLLTSGAPDLSPTDPLIASLLTDMLDCLPDRGLGKSAAGCARSLLLALPPNTTDAPPATVAIAALTFSRSLDFVLDVNDQEDLDAARPILIHALTTFTASRAPPKVANQIPSDSSLAPFTSALSLLLPALLTFASNAGPDSYTDVAGKLLAVAGAQPACFKAVVGRLEENQRKQMEEIVKVGVGKGPGRHGGAGRDGSGDDGRGEPSIALKFSFGG